MSEKGTFHLVENRVITERDLMHIRIQQVTQLTKKSTPLDLMT